eukprot:TRINITY_DN47911_c0_g1_i1.p1 TRINITY_DN47911_c0_g1~~TRINITY_DN47911_c0_g1_i1.p1  ORF type:complete len:389 (+),score=99.87 TRINITY_DN47911_c0_g1_i1:48-1169(+)
MANPLGVAELATTGSPRRDVRLQPGLRMGRDGQLEVDNVCTFLRCPSIQGRQTVDASTVPCTVEGAELLAKAGQWSDAAAAAGACASSTSGPQRLRAVHAQAIALVRAGKRQGAAEALSVLPQEELVHAPFSLRLLRAELLQKPRESETALTELLTEAEQGVQKTGDDLWRRRRREVMLRLVHCHHKPQTQPAPSAHSQQQPADPRSSGASCAVKLMQDLAALEPNNITVLVQLACLHIITGQVAAAREVLARIARYDGTDIPLLQVMGLLDVCDGKHKEAVSHFSSVRRWDDQNIAAITNKAVCEVYSGRLVAAIDMLEDAIRADPRRALASASLVHNLNAAYDLESGQAAKKKRVIQDAIQRLLGDVARAS